MKFVIPRNSFVDLVGRVSGISPRVGIVSPPLAQIRIEAKEDGSVICSATDGECEGSVTSSADVSTPGIALVSPKTLKPLLSSFPDGVCIAFSAEREQSTLFARLAFPCGGRISRYRVLSLDEKEWPAFSPDVEANSFAIDAQMFSSLVGRVIFAAETPGSRTDLACVLIEVDDGEVRAAATNGHLLATSSVGLDTGSVRGSFLVPLQKLNHLLRMSTRPDAPIEISFTKTHARFVSGDFVFTCLLAGVVFPPYQQLLNGAAQPDEVITFDRDAAIESIGRLLPLTSAEKKPIPVRVEVKDSVLNVSCQIASEVATDEIASNHAPLLAGRVWGGSIAYLRAALSASPSGVCEITIPASKKAPATISGSTENLTFFTLVAPMQL